MQPGRSRVLGARFTSGEQNVDVEIAASDFDWETALRITVRTAHQFRGDSEFRHTRHTCQDSMRLVSGATDTLRIVIPPVGAVDTSPEASEALTRSWRYRTNEERWALLVSLDADVEAIARAGIKWASPGFTEQQIDRELFRRRYGNRLTLDAYGATQSP